MVVRELITLLGFQVDEGAFKKAEGGFDKLKEGVMRLIEIVGAIEIGKKIFEEAGEMEQVAMAFENALGSAEKAGALLEDMSKFTLKTGFDKGAVEEYGKQLLFMGMSSEKIVPTLSMLGDVAAGVGKDKLPALVDAISKMQQTGKVEGRNFMAFLAAGVPLLEVLGKQTGMSVDQLRKMGNEGKITFKEIEGALRSMTGEGGKFFNLLNKQSNTLFGIIARIKNYLSELAEAIGGEVIPAVKELGQGILAFLGDNFESIKSIGVSVFEMLIFLFGFFQGVIGGAVDKLGGMKDILAGLADFINNFAVGFQAVFAVLVKLWPVIGAVIIAWKWWAIAQWLLNVAMAANPIGAIITGIVLLIAAIGWLINNWTLVRKVVGDFFQSVMNNKMIMGLLTIFTPFIGIPLTIIKNWSAISGFFVTLFQGLIKTIQPFIDLIMTVWGKVFGGATKINMSSTQNINPGVTKVPPARNNTFQIKSELSIGVPPGTPEAQKQMIQMHVEAAVKDSWQGVMRETQQNTIKTDWTGVNP